MDFISAVLSFYLLWPCIYPEQQMILDAYGKKANEREDFITRQNLIEFLQYNNFEEMADKNVVPFTVENIDEEDEENQTATSIIYKNSLDKLRLFEFGEEKLSVNSNEKNVNKSLVTVNADVVTLDTYDVDSRIIEKVQWKNSSRSEDIQMLNRTTWKYDNNISRLYENYEDNTMQVTKYNENQMPVRIQKYKNADKENSDSKIKKLQTIQIDYDKEKRIVSQIDSEFFYTGDAVSQFTKKYVYTYKKDFENPDVSYFENNILRLKTIYKSNNAFVETAYFDNNVRIESVYENNVRVSYKVINPESGLSNEK